MGRLDRAALELATIEHPGLDIEPWLTILDRFACELGCRVATGAPGEEFIEAANRYLFDELGFTGNKAHYYDPGNSCLNDVLETRSGIPITLSVVYMEVARRLARPVHGIGLPGHFIVQYDDGILSTYIDPFHGGARLDVVQCFELARRASGTEIREDLTLLAPVTHRQILQRLVNNLRAVYLSHRNFTKALRLLDLVLSLYPASAGEFKQRGAVHASLRNIAPAIADLERYLELTPEAEDREEIESQLRSLRQYLAGLN